MCKCVCVKLIDSGERETKCVQSLTLSFAKEFDSIHKGVFSETHRKPRETVTKLSKILSLRLPRIVPLEQVRIFVIGIGSGGT